VSFKKPFRAVPIQLGQRYQAQRHSERRRKRLANARFAIITLVLCAATFQLVWFLPDRIPGAHSAEQANQAAASVYYPGCNEARAAGAAPIYQGQPGYRPEMDGDGDGIACETHRQW